MNIKARRIELGITQIEAARRIGVSMSTYLLWERQVGNPSPENLEKLKRVFGEGGLDDVSND
jgi:transcriptional regulator with XRE-family HTH domain